MSNRPDPITRFLNWWITLLVISIPLGSWLLKEGLIHFGKGLL